ncbi:DNA methyltransferase [Rhodoferax sp.]|uniref:class I SAM-dependent DNA methyltransferase n=1 Tax=Rhodoferax sp. TaxID=50421 RepID=UPI0025F11B59|nr:DNA methyltransferase [Rhodoferax sp.]
MTASADPSASCPAQAFITRWRGVTASELSTAQSFVIDLCALLDLAKPHPTPEQDYMFERPVTFRHGDGSTSAGRIDCYRQGAFCLESKKLKTAGHTKGFDDGLLRARSQAENYARALPASEGRPPFVLVVDVGNVIEVYAEFSQSGGTYTPFPDPRSHRIRLDDLAKKEIRERLRQIWLDPQNLNPARISARVTRQVADLLARLAKSIESNSIDQQNQLPAHIDQAQVAPEKVASFLTRCLFSMFAEDVGLLPKEAFIGLLKTHRTDPPTLRLMLQSLWADMDRGGFSPALAAKVLHFNGKLFKEPTSDGYSLLLKKEQIDLLIEAAGANWREVEPAIFGTLLERALNPTERHALGAHYTPRAYVERLVLPTVVEPLRAEWANAQAAALVLAHEAADLDGKPALAKLAEARQQVKAFHHRLCSVRVLDPACGSGNFLYVTLEHLKRLEAEVIDQLTQLGQDQSHLGFEGETVTLQQLQGIELNPRAAALAELVLWIGWLQWHIRTQGNAAVAEPVVHDYRNIDCRDAVLAWDTLEPAFDLNGQLLSRWDGTSFKTHPVTGELVPDEAAQVPQWRYLGARQALWPQVNFVVGNPPFIGAAAMRAALGDGYVQALRSVWFDVPDSADFVMYWWARAAALVGTGAVQRMGLITTNSLRQTFNRRVVQSALDGDLLFAGAASQSAGITAGGGAGAGMAGGLILSKAQKSAPGHTHPSADAPVNKPAGKPARCEMVFAIPDHPWVDSADGAAVRIAMTVVQRTAVAEMGSDPNFAQQNLGSDPISADSSSGRLLSVTDEQPGPEGDVLVTLVERHGLIHADLTVGANVTSAVALQAMSGISSPGVKLHGAGFIVSPEEAAGLGHPDIIRAYRNGRDLTDRPRGVGVIDAFGMTADELRSQYPAVYQWLMERVKPERDAKGSSKDGAGYAKLWWLHGKPRTEMRKQLAGLSRYIATVETAKHRTFQFLDASILPDNKLVAISLSDAFHLGVLSSQLHGLWALAAGSWLGVGNDPVYVKSRCFETFPFPAEDTGLTPALREKISQLAEQIDQHRKRVLGLLAVAASTTPACPEPDEADVGGDFAKRSASEPSASASSGDRATPATATTTPSATATSAPTTPTAKPETKANPAKDLTLTGLYNVLQALREGRALSTKEKHIHSAGLVGVLKTLHDELDTAVLAAYGWAELANLTAPGDVKDELLQRLVTLNQRRAAEEATGQVRWLRPTYQNPLSKAELPAQVQQAMEVDLTSNPVAPAVTTQSWPSALPEQVKAVAQFLSSSPTALTLAQIAACFGGSASLKKSLPTLLQTLEALGRAQQIQLNGTTVWRA